MATAKKKPAKKKARALPAPIEDKYDTHLADGGASLPCNWNPKARVDLTAAKWATNFLKRRTAEDPWFNGLTLLLHSGQVDYTKHQLVVERILSEGPQKALDKEWFRKVACTKFYDPFTGKVTEPLTKPLQFIEKAPRLAKRFIERCGEKGLKCKGKNGIERVLSQLVAEGDVERIPVAIRKRFGSTPVVIPAGSRGCDKNDVSSKTATAGFGPKIRELAREYAGNPDAVAVDRHIGAWICGNFQDDPVVKAACQQGFPALKLQEIIDTQPGTDAAAEAEKKLAEIKQKTQLNVSGLETDKTYRVMKGKVAREAKRCGVAPAVMQVGAWFKQACRKEDPTKGIFGKESEHDYVWLGTTKKLPKGYDVACDATNAMIAACADESPRKLYNPKNSIGFCSQERKKSFCKVFAERTREFEGKKADIEAADALFGISKKHSKKHQSCNVAARRAFISLLDRAA